MEGGKEGRKEVGKEKVNKYFINTDIYEYVINI